MELLFFFFCFHESLTKSQEEWTAHYFSHLTKIKSAEIDVSELRTHSYHAIPGDMTLP